jgi:Tfp pilus assembly protein PilO
MTRIQIVLAALAAVLTVVLFWLLVWSPRADEIVELRAETEDIEMQQQQTAGRIAALEAVRAEAPQQEALLAASQALLPRDAALPAFLRQLQVAADEAGLALKGVSPARPAPEELETAPADLHRINVAMEVEGGYFQIVDFLRRIEDPEITPRAMVWNALAVAGDPEDHPVLQASLQGDLYALLPTTPAEGEAPPVDEEAAQEGDDTDVEVDVEEDAE